MAALALRMYFWASDFFFFFFAMWSMWDPSSPTRDWTHAPCIGSSKSQPLDCQGSPSLGMGFWCQCMLLPSWWCGQVEKHRKSSEHDASAAKLPYTALRFLAVCWILTAGKAQQWPTRALEANSYQVPWVLSHFNRVWCFATLWTVALQAPLSMGFSGQEYWSGLPCPPLGHLPNPGIKLESLPSPAMAGRFFTTGTTREAPTRYHLTAISQLWHCQTFFCARVENLKEQKNFVP